MQCPQFVAKSWEKVQLQRVPVEKHKASLIHLIRIKYEAGMWLVVLLQHLCVLTTFSGNFWWNQLRKGWNLGHLLRIRRRGQNLHWWEFGERYSHFFKRGPVIYLMCSYVWKQASQQLRKWCTMLDLDMGRCGIHSDRWYTTKMAFISEFLMLQIISSSFCVVLLPFSKLGFTPEKLRFTPIQRCLYSHALISPPFSSSRPGVPRWDGCCSRGGLVDLHEAMDTTSAEARWGRCGDDFRPAEPWGFNQTTGGLVENHHF